MFTDPVDLIDQTINHLNAVAELMKEEFDPRVHHQLHENGVVCRSAYMRIQELIPKLQAARATQASSGNMAMQRLCVDCE